MNRAGQARNKNLCATKEGLARHGDESQKLFQQMARDTERGEKKGTCSVLTFVFAFLSSLPMDVSVCVSTFVPSVACFVSFGHESLHYEIAF